MALNAPATVGRSGEAGLRRLVNLVDYYFPSVDCRCSSTS